MHITNPINQRRYQLAQVPKEWGAVLTQKEVIKAAEGEGYVFQSEKVRKHFNSKPFQCEICVRRFISKWNLDKHKRIATCKKSNYSELINLEQNNNEAEKKV